jgi:hypothetical protein
MASMARIVRKIFIVGGWAPLLVFGIHGILSRVFHAYDAFPPSDIPMHFLGGVSMAFFISGCFQALPREMVRSSRIVVLELILVGSLTATAAMVWEFAEFACDLAFGTNIQRGLQNTMQDMALGLAGALAVIIGRAWQLKARAEELRAVADEWLYGRAVLR